MRAWLPILILTLTLPTCSNDGGDGTLTPTDIAPANDTAPVDVTAPPADSIPHADTTSDSVELPLDTTCDGWCPTHSSFPQELPFTVERPAKGNPLTDAEVTAFTEKIMAFYKDAMYFEWLWWTGHGLDASYDPDLFDYKLFWQDTKSIKEGDVVRFVHVGGADNLALRTAKLLSNVCAAYLMTGDQRFGRLVEAYSKGFVALSLGLEWETEDPIVKYLQARAIFTIDHEYEMEGARKVKVEYGEMKKGEVYSWNAHTVPNDENPHWGPIWIRNMRSKDDVPHMYRMVPMLRRVAEVGKDAEVRDAAALAVEYMEGFAKDIVNSGYQIRTKEDGVAYVPLNENGTVNDLASFVLFEPFFPNAECNAKIASAFVGFGDALDNDCGLADGNMYEDVAIDGHFFNLAIIRYFHLASLGNALIAEDAATAEELMEGVINRADRYMYDPGTPGEDMAFPSDLAAWLLAAGATGVPLTDAEARHITDWYSRSVDHYLQHPAWDPWDPAVPDGDFEYKAQDWSYDEPGATDGPKTRYVRLTEMSFVFEYCWSPYRSGANVLDCDLVKNPARW